MLDMPSQPEIEAVRLSPVLVDGNSLATAEPPVPMKASPKLDAGNQRKAHRRRCRRFLVVSDARLAGRLLV